MSLFASLIKSDHHSLLAMECLNVMPSPSDVLQLLKVPDTGRLKGVHMHSKDAAVLEALNGAWKTKRDALIACEVGVRNTRGEIYRRAALKGVAQMLYFEERMAKLGFRPELEAVEHEGSGYDVIFRDASSLKPKVAGAVHTPRGFSLSRPHKLIQR